ncbi:MAG TPA: lysylphosphatidylglycerol synthase domain-containing protein [Mycobacteriales bacterium]|nr:lysylphosphatidylglycerol synthase domain-containing protein [Mycobacteriales bacterium]
MRRGLAAVEDLAERLGSRGSSGKRNPWLLWAALVLFIATLVWSLRDLPHLPGGAAVWWELAVIGLIGVPILAAYNAAEFILMARIVDQRVRWWSATRISLYGSAANLLPLPGAALVRLEALRRSDVQLRRSVQAAAVVAAIWIGASTMVAGLAQVPQRWTVVGLGVAGGIVPLTLGGAVLARGRPPAETRGHLVRLVGLEALYVPTAGVRLWFVGKALHEPISLRDAVTIAAAGTLATAAGIFPGGLGLRELLSGALAALTGVPAVTGVAISAVDRVSSLAGLAVWTGVVALLDQRMTPEAPADDGPPGLDDPVPDHAV